MENVLNLKDFKKQIKRDNSMRRVREKVREQIIASVITMIEAEDNEYTSPKVSEVLNKLIMMIRSLI